MNEMEEMDNTNNGFGNLCCFLRKSVEDSAVVGVSMATMTSIVNLAFWMG